MLNTFFESICRTGIFMIFAQAIAHFRPNESYEKYLKLLVSTMILIQLFLPLGAVFSGGGESAAKQLDSFRESLEEGLREAKEQTAETDRILEQMTLEEVRRRMEAQAAGAEAVSGAASAKSEDASGTETKGVAGAARAETEDSLGAAESERTLTTGGAELGKSESDRVPEGIEVQVEPVEPVSIGEGSP